MTRYEYCCSRGHYIAACSPCGCCPVYVHGTPCTGTLKRIGAGSRPRRPLVEATR